MLLTTWSADGLSNNHLSDNNSSNVPELLILGIVLLAVWFLLTAMFAYYIFQFKKTSSDKKLYGKTMLWINGILGAIEVVCAILVLVFWGTPGSIVDLADDDKIQALGNACIGLLVVAFVILVALIVMMWFFLPYYGIAFSDSRIMFMGEDIKYEQITKIVVDEKTHAIYINYKSGRNYRRLKFSAGNQFGAFVQENSSLTGHKAEKADENAYFESLMNQNKTK